MQKRLLTLRESERVTKARQRRFWKHRRARHLLTDKAFCGSCGGPLAAIGADHLACSKARRTGTCANRRSVRRGVFEDLILGALKSQLLTPDLVATFISEFHQEINRRRREEELAKSTIEAELTVVAKKLDGLIDAIVDGLRAPGLQQRLEKFEERKAALERLLAAPALPPVRLHPNLAPLYRERVAKLHAALANPESRTEALELVRSLIDRVELRPAEGGFHVELVGEIANMVTLSAGAESEGSEASRASVEVVAGAGSGLCDIFNAQGLEPITSAH